MVAEQRSLIAPILIALAILAAAPAARADAIELEVRSPVWKGRDVPALILHINEPIRVLNIELKGDNGKTIEDHWKGVKAGTTQEIRLPADVGTTTFKGRITAHFSDDRTGSMPLTFSVEVATQFDIDVREEALDLKKGELILTLTRPAGHCEYKVLIERKPEIEGVEKFDGEPPGTPLKITWETWDPDDLTLRIVLKCFDPGGVLHTGRELYPWNIDIPHEDVVFDSAKWNVKNVEAPKLEAAYAEIAKAVERYGRWITGVKLFVVGHTDTVGDKGYNRELSFKRARAIAKYFRKLGVRVPIQYTGVGEDDLAVGTPDETAEQANRRAEYVIGVTEPQPGNWQGI